MDTILKDRLLTVANSFSIDEILDVTLEKRGDDVWAICHGSHCLNASGEWEYESLPSSRTNEFKKTTRFDSLEAAIDFYVEWRSHFYFFSLRGEYDRTWVCHVQSKDLKECENSWDRYAEKRGVFGRWIIIGTDRSILREAKGESGDKIKFKDFPSGIIL